MSRPLVYELNTRCWLRELSDAVGRRLTLATVPGEQFNSWARLGFTHVWLMGVWSTGPRSRDTARNNHDLRQLCAESFSDWSEEDLDSSPYAIAGYSVAPSLGGEKGLAEFRDQLRQRGIGLILDFVPNHTGLDHPWLVDRPDLFVQSQAGGPDVFPVRSAAGLRWIAHGKDPYFPPWNDTAQLDYRNPQTRAAMIDTLKSIAARCDGVRCDMAMLILNDVFQKTWERLPAPVESPKEEFWTQAIRTTKAAWPNFLLMAEAYWNLELRLQGLGFAYNYDKLFYDHLVRRDFSALRAHLRGFGATFSTARFLENHDEPRIAAQFNVGEQKPAALLLLGQPGLRLLYHGQLTGRTRRTPVQLTRYLTEPANPVLHAFYEKLLETIAKTDFARGEIAMLDVNTTRADMNCEGVFLFISQTNAAGFGVIVVNMSSQFSRVWANLAPLEHGSWTSRDLLATGEPPSWQGSRLELNLPPHGFRLLEFAQAGSG